MTRFVLAALLAAVSLPAPPAHAAAVVSGASCGMSNGNDHTAVFLANPDTYLALVTGGPVAVEGERPDELHVECVVFIDDHEAHTVERTHVDADGVLLAEHAMSLAGIEQLDVCTRVWWRSRDTTTRVDVDLDPATEGVQCARAGRMDGGWPYLPGYYVVPVVFEVVQ